MPSLLLIIPFLQYLVDKRKPQPESDDVERGGQRSRLSRRNSNLGGKSNERRVAREKVRGGTLAQDTEQSKKVSAWRRIKDYLWGQEDEESRGEYIPNYRWTPILSGVIIPFAILLEIPGLTEHWYIKTEGNKTIETQENPKILDAGLAISMASAVIANIALIWAKVDMFVSAYGQAFWMTICSTIASVITTISLAWDLYRTPEFARSGSGLTRKQRSLVIIVMVLLCYIALGAMSVGFGDIVLTTTLGRVFSIFYNTFGIINLGLAVSTTRETIIESFENSYRKRRAERERMKHARAQIRAAEQMLRRLGVPVYVPLQGRHVDSGATLVQERSPHLGMRARTMTIGSIASSLVPYPGGGRRHMGRTHREGMVLNVWALSEEQRNALFGDDAANMPGSPAVTEGVGAEYGERLVEEPAGEADVDPATLIERFHEELGGPAHEEESPDYSELKARLESEEKKEFAVKASLPMTILISVLTEAYSSRYKTVIHSGVLDRAVKSIRAQRRTRTHAHAHAHLRSSPSPSHHTPNPDALAVDIVTNARAIREHMAWFVNSNGMKGAPEGVLKVLDDIAEGENMDERVKKEFMSNDEARKTVFIMSFERMLHNLACAAEEAARMPRSRRTDDDGDDDGASDN
ncbi:hypothetical protein FRC10_001386 [Ceratobasidium sp. 414]|nr:hypothetical protein FRC10_001386 [Ceratobasidium sp. 414]